MGIFVLGGRVGSRNNSFIYPAIFNIGDIKMKRKIPICTTHLPSDIIQAVTDVLESGWIGQNKVVEEFEEAFGKKYGYKHCVAVNSCTSSLRLALAVARVGYGDQVITTPHTFPATNTVILEQNAEPIFADVQYLTGNIDPESIRKKLTCLTQAIMVVGYMGLPPNMDEIYRLAREEDLLVIEDMAQAIGATYRGAHVCQKAKFGCFSFQAVKQVTCGDGGMFVTNDRDIYEEALRRSWFGFTKKERSGASHSGKCDFDIKELGFKYRMNAIAASMGLVQLKYVDRLIKERRDRAKIYTEGLEGVSGVTLFEQFNPLDRQSACYMYPIHVKRRPQFLKKMNEAGIEAFVHDFRNDQFSIFYGKKDPSLKNTNRFDETFVCLPLHHEVTRADLGYIIKNIKEGW